MRATLRYLSEIGGFDPTVYRQIHALLAKGTIDLAASIPISPASSRAAETQAEELGKRNAWLRKTLSETSILPTTVETALSPTAGPLLSDDQKQAIVQLVEYSQKGVAAITNHAPINTHNWQTGVDSIADTATLTVLSDPVTGAGVDSKQRRGNQHDVCRRAGIGHFVLARRRQRRPGAGTSAGAGERAEYSELVDKPA